MYEEMLESWMQFIDNEAKRTLVRNPSSRHPDLVNPSKHDEDRILILRCGQSGK